MRLAWQPAFQSGSLEGYTDLMDECAATLAQVRARRGGGRGSDMNTA
jgi:cytochrome P450